MFTFVLTRHIPHAAAENQIDYFARRMALEMTNLDLDDGIF